MIINQEKCHGCALCVPYCVTNAITIVNKKAIIDRELCVECSVCMQVDVCKNHAFEEDELEWPRSIRRTYSNVMSKHPQTGMTGRGTPEMKTNELTGKYKRGEVGLGVELGRPDVCTTFRDVEKVAKMLAASGFTFDHEAPTTMIMTDPTVGSLPPEILNERVICVILEGKAPTEKLPVLLEGLKKVSKEIDTVFSLDVITVEEEDGSVPNIEIARRLGYPVRPNAKTTVGLGRPA
ncbi:MAG: 4Fe-4S binding protein [Anaerolineae bacterium]|nr:4Fe-4S binding protein [Anaerolineae bacterium]